MVGHARVRSWRRTLVDDGTFEMQEYLVSIELGDTRGIDENSMAELRSAEWVRGQELRARGTLKRIWRIPGRDANVGIWTANNATELHEAITSLPLYPWMTVTVTELATHPQEVPDPEQPSSPREDSD